MKKAIGLLALCAMLLLAVGIANATEGKTMAWTGWLSDSACAAKGMAASHVDCAIKCVKEKGAKWVFVNSETKQVLNIHNQDAVSERHVGHEVKVTGHVMDDGSLHVDKIEAASSGM